MNFNPLDYTALYKFGKHPFRDAENLVIIVLVIFAVIGLLAIIISSNRFGGKK